MKTRKRLPVLFFIHGGTFLVGSGSDSYIDGKSYNENGVILVTINYRLGVLGFLSYPYLTEVLFYFLFYCLLFYLFIYLFIM